MTSWKSGHYLISEYCEFEKVTPYVIRRDENFTAVGKSNKE